MHALILAAGPGSRLSEAVPKCLVDVGGKPLLSHQLDAVRNAGAERVTVVVGHGHEQVRAVAGAEVGFVLNDRYAETNSLYSFGLAQSAIKGDLFVLNCDVLFPAHLLHELAGIDGSALAFDSGSGEEGEHMKVRIRKGRLVRMSKQLPRRQSHGENVGVLCLTEAAAKAAFAAAASLVRRGRERDWLGAAINAIAPRHPISCVDVAGFPWIEIDFPHDLAAARTRVWPEIQVFEPLRPGFQPAVG